MKIVCTNSTDPTNIVETASPKRYTDEAEACAARDALREENGANQFLWFEVMPDDYVLMTPKPVAAPTAPASTPIGNEPDGTPQ